MPKIDFKVKNLIFFGILLAVAQKCRKKNCYVWLWLHERRHCPCLWEYLPSHLIFKTGVFRGMWINRQIQTGTITRSAICFYKNGKVVRNVQLSPDMVGQQLYATASASSPGAVLRAVHATPPMQQPAGACGQKPPAGAIKSILRYLDTDWNFGWFEPHILIKKLLIKNNECKCHMLKKPVLRGFLQKK